MPDRPGRSGRIPWQQHLEQERQRREREHAALEDSVLARAARLGPGDQSLEARHLRETAASIADHREMAALRSVRAAADALGVTAPPSPAGGELAAAGMTRTSYCQAQAVYLRRLRESRDNGNLDDETARWEATLYRDPADMARAAQGLPSGGGGWMGTDAARWAP